ncbi:glycoside hydrolase family 113 [Jidongwangia harbinensis]|uniref:glycoside hydrolase family 113 n=1 Tax=Jidongwangia harbinensis TaxID=2878561 RepID=UPI001CD9DF53|nr:hypothetical protein [Jidongwangia harbinensis]MCA2219276.1 hypothetical protein [Jidongwangia harbinensis]
MSRRTAGRGAAASLVAGGVLTALLLIPGEDRNGTPSHPDRAAAPRTDHRQRGFAMPTYTAEGYRSPHAERYLDQIAATGATWVQFNPTWYQERTDGHTIAAAPHTPTDAALEHVISAAHRAGLRVLLKPLLDLAADNPGYRGTIRPADRAAWFASYTAFIGHYADLGARLGVAQFAVGTELAGVSADRAGWLRVIETVRGRYPGRLLYAANFDEYRHVAFWDAVDLIGIDAYWELSERPTTDVAALRRAWQPVVRELTALAVRTGRSVLFTEAGYTSRRGTTTAPWDWTVGGGPDQAEQAAAYQALLASLDGQRWWAGVFWWCWDVPPGSAGTDPLGYSPHGKAAEAVVRRWWT